MESSGITQEVLLPKMLISKGTTVLSAQHIGRRCSKGLDAKLPVISHPIYVKEPAIRTVYYSLRRNKEQNIRQIRRAWCTRQLQEGGIYKKEPAASRQTYSAAVVGFRHT